MATQIQLRNGTAAAWTSTNPTLNQGELGVETDTGQFKIGTGTTAWTSLAYQSTAGPAQTNPYRSLGDGSDGNVTINSSIVLSRDMYYNNLTINGAGNLSTANFKIFVKGVLDLTAAPAGAINNNSLAGGNASGATGGSAPTTVVAGTMGATNNGGAGANGGTGNGVNGGATSGTATGNGGSSNGAGAGGAGNATTAGAGGISVTPTVLPVAGWITNFVKGITLLNGGAGCGGGGSGGGDGVSASGGGGGAGGSGGGALILYANIILTSAATSASCIQSLGGAAGMGGNGATTGGSTGGGGGGGGGSGGWIYILYNQRFGPLVLGMLDTSAGAGGGGGNGFSAGLGGHGGNGGNAGTIQTFQIQTGLGYRYTAVNIFSGTTWVAQLSGSPAIGNTGGAGGLGQPWLINF